MLNNIKKIEKHHGKTEVWYNDDVWVAIDTAYDDIDGSWEYQEGDDEETYWEGSFWVDRENKKLIVDYDGISVLPQRVIVALEYIGFDCSEIKIND